MSSTLAVIMAGGSGTRFYPLSNKDRPKQFLNLFGEGSMISQTFHRVSDLFDKQNFLVASNENYKELLEEHLNEVPSENFLFEPSARNTGPALGLVCLKALSMEEDPVLVSLHADHFIEDEKRFCQILERGIERARLGKIALIGITPDCPETGYGYIQRGEVIDDNDPGVYEVLDFLEKPNLEKAKQFLAAGDYLWNAGMFIFKAKVLLEEIEKFDPELYQGLMKIKNLGKFEGTEFQELFSQLKSVPIDVAVMERTKLVEVIPGDFGWSDVGSYSSLYQLHSESPEQDVALTDTQLKSLDSKGNLVSSCGKKIMLLGVEDLMVIETEDSILVGKLDRSQDVKKLID